jgi:hypothetical protein
MGNYIIELKSKYGDLIKEVEAGKSSGSLKGIIKEIVQLAESRKIKSTKAEIRDALMVLAATGRIKIEKKVPKMLEVKLK